MQKQKIFILPANKNLQTLLIIIIYIISLHRFHYN